MAYIRKRNGKWQAAIRLPNGDRISTSDPLKKVVQNWAADEEAKLRHDRHHDPRAGEIRVSEWYERVSAARVVDTPTAKKNASLWRTHCEARWGRWPMNTSPGWKPKPG